MKKTTLNKSLFLLCAAIVMGGCANSEDHFERRNQESTTINGASYASAEEIEASLFGSSCNGLSSNPKNKPSSDKLGNSGVFSDLDITVEPVKGEALINEMIKFKVTWKDWEDRENDKESKAKESDAQFVVVLERASGANGSLVVNTSTLKNATQWPATETEAVVKSQNKSFEFTLATGTSYNNKGKPVYYINIWNADLDDPIEVPVYVNKPAQIGDDGIKAGTKDIENDPSKPADDAFGESQLNMAYLTPLDGTTQQLYADLNRSVRVKLTGFCDGSENNKGKKTCDCEIDENGICPSLSMEGEPICVTFIEYQEGGSNDGYLNGVGSDDIKGDIISEDNGKMTACGTTGSDGIFTASIYTGHAYDARYFVNFFHPAAGSPVTYQIDTFALPASLGEPGGVAAIIDEGLKLDLSDAEVDPDTGKLTLSGDSAQSMLDSIFPPAEDANGNPIPLLQDASGYTFTCSNLDKEGNCLDDDGNVIKFITDEKGNRYIVTEEKDSDGNVIGYKDPNGNTYYVDSETRNYIACFAVSDGKCIDSNGKTLSDSVEPITKLNAQNVTKENSNDLVMTDANGNIIYAKEPTELYGDIMGQCMVDGVFMCEASQNEDGSWTFNKVTYEGTYDTVTGESKDCNPVVDENCGYTSKTTEPIQSDVDGDGKKDDPVSIVVTTDDEGNSYFGGFDTDGDGVTDVAADPCLLTKEKQEELGLKCVKGADRWFEFRCKGEDKTEYAKCSKFTAPMSSSLGVDVKLVAANGFEIDEDSGEVSKIDGGAIDQSGNTNIKGQEIRGKIIREVNGPANNAKFGGKDGEDEVSGLTDADGEYTYPFWTGESYGSLYYISASNEHTASKNIPISIYNAISLPTSQGDKPDSSVLQPGGEAMTPPGDMPAYDANLGPVTISIAPDISDNIASPVVKKVGFKVMVRKDNTAKTLVPNTNTYWKITRGASTSNNGSLDNSKVKTNKVGIAENKFYTGTGYDALYYISVFHPNALDETGAAAPVVFTVLTTNNTGTVPGFDSDEDPSKPEGDSTDSNGNKPGDEDFNAYDLVTVNGEATYSKYPQGPGCGNNICSNDKKNECASEKVPECCGMTTCMNGSKQGCLEIRIVGDDTQLAEIGSTYAVKVQVVWKNGDEEEAVRGNVVWTLDKGDQADGQLPDGASVARTSLNKNGIATLKFSTGSKETTYRLNAMYPNIHDENGDMIPKSITISVKDKSQIPQKASDKNYVKATVSTKNIPKIADNIRYVDYYVLSNKQYSCDETFIFNDSDARKAQCQAFKDGENKKLCDLTGRDADNKFIVTQEMTSYRDAFVVYAVASNADGELIATGCEPYTTFGYPVVTSCEESEQKSNGKCPSVRTAFAEVELSETPLVINTVKPYYLETIIDIGPLIEDGTAVGKGINNLFEKYKNFTENSGSIGETVVNNIFKYIDYSSDASGTFNNCVEYVGKKVKDENKCRSSTYKNGTFEKGTSPIGMITSCELGGADYQCYLCTGSSCDSSGSCQTIGGSQELSGDKDHYTACDCPCYTFLYWTGVNKIGKKLTPLIRKGLKALIDKYISAEAIENTMCNIMDELQYLTLTGEMSLTRQSSTIGGKATYDGLYIPYLDKTVSLSDGGSQLEGLKYSLVMANWTNGTVSEDGTQLSLKNYSINFTYGTFIKNALLSMFGNLSEDGTLDLTTGLLNCDKLKSLSLPLVGNIGEQAATICQVALNIGDDYIANLSLNASWKLGVNLNVEGEFDRGDRCQSVAEGTGNSNSTMEGCMAQVIKNGTMSGSGSLGQNSAKNGEIRGLWAASTDKNKIPEIVSGTDNLDTWKANGSVCRNRLKKAEVATSDDYSNRICLGGTFDKPSMRASYNVCAQNDGCKKSSVVVCDDKGNFISKYATYSAAQIIKEANDYCKAKNGCSDNNNDEIVNGGKGINNIECLAEGRCAQALCNDNPAIVVCNEGSVIDKDTMEGLCSDCSGYNPSNLNTFEPSDKCKTCLMEASRKACVGQCDKPQCVMYNDANYVCANTADEIGQNQVEVLATWSSFDAYLTNGVADSNTLNQLKSDVSSITADGCKSATNKSACQNGITLSYHCDGALIKMVAGKDGALGALGTQAVAGSSDNCYFAINGNNITKVTFNAFGNERVIHYGSNDKNDKVETSASDWHSLTANNPSNELKIWPTADDKKSSKENDYKAMRLDDIVVYGTK